MRHGGDAGLDPRTEAEVELEIGAAGEGVGVPEAAGLEEGGGDGTPAGRKVLQARQRRPVRLGVAVIGVRAGAFGDGEEVELVLKVRAHLRAVEDDGDAEAPKVVGGADAESCNSRGEPMAPDEWMTSVLARWVVSLVWTPNALPFSTTIRRTCWPVLPVRFERPRAGFRTAVEVEQRRYQRWVS